MLTKRLLSLFSPALLALLLACPRAHALDLVSDFGTNPGNLKLYEYVPAGTTGSQPLVLLLHGCLQDASGYAEDSGWLQVAEELGIALAVAEQSYFNNISACFNWFDEADNARDQGEAMSLRQMVSYMVDNHTIDASRVYVAGTSSGAAMAAVMLATYPEVFQAGAVMSGMAYRCASGATEAYNCMNGACPAKTAQELGELVRTASSSTGPWPRVSIWAGSADTTVRPVNAQTLAQQWTNVHGLAEAPTSVEQNGVDMTQLWKDADGTVLVERHLLDGMNHGTSVNPGTGPTQCGATGTYFFDTDICAVRVAAQFFGLSGSPVTADGGVTTTDAGTPSPDGGTVAADGGSVVTADGGAPAADAGSTARPDASSGTDAGSAPPSSDGGQKDSGGEEDSVCACAHAAARGTAALGLLLLLGVFRVRRPRARTGGGW